MSATDSKMNKSVDVEQPLHDDKPTRPTPLFFMESAALLTLWSLLVINEGAIRFIRSVPSKLSRDTLPTDMSPYLVFLGGLAEVIFGVGGLVVGMSAFLLRSHSLVATKSAMFIQTILGWFVFIVFVFYEPSVRASNIPEPILGLSISESKVIITMGILTSVSFCLALQGGQFIFFARLVCAATGDDFLKQKTGAYMRAFFWNGNLSAAGLWTLITGALITNRVGGGRTIMPYVSPPNVGTLPVLTVVVGLVMLLWGFVGMAMAAGKTAPTMYFVGTALVYLLMMLNYGILQFGMFADGTAGGPIALHNGLVFMIVFLGAYFVAKAQEEHEEQQQM